MNYKKTITLFLTFSIIVPLCCCWGKGQLELEKAPEKQHDCCTIPPSDADQNHQTKDGDCEHEKINKLFDNYLVIDKSQANLRPPVFESTYTLSDYHRLTSPFDYVAKQINCVSNAPPLLQVHCVYLL